jgi:hypothetical protein
LSDGLENLIIYALTDKDAVKAIYDYYVLDLPPSILSGKYGIRKYVLRGYLARVSASGRIKLVKFLKENINKLLELPLIYNEVKVNDYVGGVKQGKTYYSCRICGKVYKNIKKVRYHIRFKHKDYINNIITQFCRGG